MSEKRELPGGDGGGHGFNKRAKTEASFGEGSPGISKVLHVRNVSPETSHEELVAFVSQFGSVVAICFLSKFQQALVEMESPQAASAVIMYSKQTPVYIRGKEVHFEYSKSPSINTNATPKTFENAYSAVQAYTALDGKDIYAGSCTLKIEFSRAEKLNVHVNNDKSRDYTNPHLPGVAPAPTQPPPPPPPPAPYYHHQSNSGGYPAPPSGQPFYPPPPQHSMPGLPPMPGNPNAAPNAVLIVYGLEDPMMNVDRVFNIFCLFGNVSKIKIITHKKGSALVHMETAEMADRALNSLNGTLIFGHPLMVQYSKHQYIAESRNDIEASATGTNQNTKDFTTSSLNRFRANPNAFRHIYKPSATLHFANAPREFNEQDFARLFTSLGAKPQANFKFFSQYPHNYNNNNPNPNPNQMNQSTDERRFGLLEWADVPSAVEALVVANNHKIGSHTLKLSFTANAIIHGNDRRFGGPPPPGGHPGPSPSPSPSPLSPSPSPSFSGSSSGSVPPPPVTSSSDSIPPPPSSAPPPPAPPSPSLQSSPPPPGPSSSPLSSSSSSTTAPPPPSSSSSPPSPVPPPSPPRSPSPSI